MTAHAPDSSLHLYLYIKHLYIKRMQSEQETSGIHLWLLLWKAARALDAHARQSVVSLGMCPSDFGVLEALLHKGPLPVNILGRKVLLTSGSMTAAVDRLERRGLVTRKSDPADRRTRVVHLTRQGRALIRRLFTEHARHMEHATAFLGSEERNSLAALLRKLGRGSEDMTKDRK